MGVRKALLGREAQDVAEVQQAMAPAFADQQAHADRCPRVAHGRVQTGEEIPGQGRLPRSARRRRARSSAWASRSRVTGLTT